MVSILENTSSLTQPFPSCLNLADWFWLRSGSCGHRKILQVLTQLIAIDSKKKDVGAGDR